MTTLKTMRFLVIIILLSSCTIDKTERASLAYDHGMELSLKADKLLSAGDKTAAHTLYAKAIEQFKQAVAFAPEHPTVEGSIGLTYFEMEKYEIAQQWFEKAIIKNDTDAFNFQFLGLSQISKGKVEIGEKNIEKALALDTSLKFRNTTIGHLVNIGKRAFNTGEGYLLEGNTQKEKDYKNFSIRVLWMAFNWSEQDRKIAELIKKYAERMEDEALLKWLDTQLEAK